MRKIHYESSDLQFSLVIPCFNEESGILPTLRHLQEELEGAGPYEVIVVDDGSSDDTPEVLVQAQERFPGLRVLTHGRNLGYGAALKTGIRHASSDWIVITDADGTYPAAAVPGMLPMTEGPDMVVGARTGSEVRYPFIRRIPKFFLRALAAWIAGQTIPDLNSGLRAFRRELAEKFMAVLPNGFSFTTSITMALISHGYNVSFHPIDYAERTGRSKIRPVRDTLRIGGQILRLGMYLAPLRLLMPLVGILALLFVASLGFDVFVLKDLTDKTVLLLTATLNSLLFGLLADMIDRRSS